jgi:hypothetical protein
VAIYPDRLALAVQAHGAEAVVISAGWDAHKDDPLSRLKVTSESSTGSAAATRQRADQIRITSTKDRIGASRAGTLVGDHRLAPTMKPGGWRRFGRTERSGVRINMEGSSRPAAQAASARPVRPG